MSHERVLQFRIGMFVIFAALVLVMLIVWFGETPTLFRDQRFLVVRYDQAPGVAEGIPVRKNGIRIGEVVAIHFDERPGQPDGVLITLALDSRHKLRSGSVPRITRGLIGDVWIDMLPATSAEPLLTSRTPELALKHIVQGTVTPDPSNALAAATEAFQDAKPTLQAIEAAASGLAEVTKKAENIDEFITSFRDMGQKVGILADQLNAVLGDNAQDIRPLLTNIRQVTENLNKTLDPHTQANLRAAAEELAAGSARINKLLAELTPLAADLGAGPDHLPVTVLGQTLARAGRVVYNIQLLADTLHDGQGRLNTNGTLQRLLTDPEIYNNLAQLSTSTSRVMAIAERALSNFNRFAERIANDPSALTRGALQR
jgi:phospholipid/cholesterol/gamma-HCH transport system substrate-binding protein